MPYRRRIRQRLPSDPYEVTLVSVQREHSGFQAEFDAVYDQFKAAVELEQQSQFVPLIASAIRLVEAVSKQSGDSGEAKQQLAMALLQKLIDDSALSQTDKVTLQVLLESLGPSIIDFGIEAARGNLLNLPSLWRRLSCCGK